MKLYKKGLTVKRFITELQKLNQNAQVLISSDEEGNTIYQGFYIDAADTDIVLAGLTGCEMNE